MSILLLLIAAVAVIGSILAFALVTAATGAERGRMLSPLNALSELRSPSGKPFFPDSQSVTELARALKSVHELATPAEAPSPRREVSDPRRRPPRAVATPRPAR